MSKDEHILYMIECVLCIQIEESVVKKVNGVSLNVFVSFFRRMASEINRSCAIAMKEGVRT